MLLIILILASLTLIFVITLTSAFVCSRIGLRISQIIPLLSFLLRNLVLLVSITCRNCQFVIYTLEFVFSRYSVSSSLIKRLLFLIIVVLSLGLSSNVFLISRLVGYTVISIVEFCIGKLMLS